MAEGESSSAKDDAFIRSSYIESIIEQAFIADLLRLWWSNGIRDVEVLRAGVDAWGYDLVFSRGSVMRHVQLKTSKLGGKTARVPISGKLGDKPGGCVIWMLVDHDTLQFGPFLWFGKPPWSEAPSLRGFERARRPTRNASGERPLRRDTFELLRRHCEPVEQLAGIAALLFPLREPCVT